MNNASDSQPIPEFKTLEEMVAWFEAQPKGRYQLLWGGDGARITTPNPPYKTLVFIADARGASILWDRLKGIYERAIHFP